MRELEEEAKTFADTIPTCPAFEATVEARM